MLYVWMRTITVYLIHKNNKRNERKKNISNKSFNGIRVETVELSTMMKIIQKATEQLIPNYT